MAETLRDALCAVIPLFAALFGISVVLLVLLVLTVPFVDSGSGTYYTSLVTGVLLLVSIIGSAGVIRACRRE